MFIKLFLINYYYRLIYLDKIIINYILDKKSFMKKEKVSKNQKYMGKILYDNEITGKRLENNSSLELKK